MANERPGQTLQATALVHEVYLRLVSGEDARWQGRRRHFFGAAAEAMRRILVENARRKKRLKHGGQWEQVDVEDVDIAAPMPDDDLLAMDEALDRLAAADARAAELVKLCFFGGLTQEQAAKELDSPSVPSNAPGPSRGHGCSGKFKRTGPTLQFRFFEFR